MIPFDVKMGKNKASITFESLFYFFVVTAVATTVGELVYTKWVEPYINKLPTIPGEPPAAS